MSKQLRWVRILPKADFEDQNDFIRLVKAENKTLCLIRTAGEYFATQAQCPHAGAPLSEGWCKNQKLICPYHRYAYDLRTGKGGEGQGDYIEIFPVKEDDENIYIGLTVRNNWLKRLFRL